jgi:hypothetical protein
MKRTRPAMLPDLDADPFGERPRVAARKTLHLLGGRFQFDSNSQALLRLVDLAYAGMPLHRLSTPALDFKIRLLLREDAQPGHRRRSEPPPIGMFSGAGFLGGATDASNFVILSPQQRAGLVVVSPQMLKFPYHTRYELIEFAVFSLASRAQNLASLHGACVGRGGRGVLLMGPSGSGKSTITLLSALQGLDFVSEDSVFVTSDAQHATGVANFLHVRADSLRWLGRMRDAAAIRKSPVIRRRSGVRKYEIDLRRGGYRLAPAPLRIAAVVFLSPESAGKRPPLRLLSKSAARAHWTAAQAYAAGQPDWPEFLRRAALIDAFELRRSAHPMQSVEIIRSLLPPD